MYPLEKCWFPAAWSKDLRNNHRAAKVLGQKVVAFRNKDGAAAVIEDRCPHRGIELSRGKTVEGCIRCPYHGWAFDGRGRCVDIPSLAEKDKFPHVCVQSYPVVERDGVVWFSFSAEPYFAEPPDWHFLHDRAFTATIDIYCDYIRVMENLVDNPHAGFLHKGILRNKPETQVVAEIEERASGVHINTVGETSRGSLLQRVFGRRHEVIYHTEEFVYPNIIKTVFGQGGLYASSQFICVPIDEGTTRWLCRVTLDYGLLTPLLFPIFKAAVLKILHQDKLMLEHVVEQDRLCQEGPRVSTKADVPSIWVTRAAKAFAQQGPRPASDLRSISVTYRL